MSPAQRLQTTGWLNGRSAFGILLVVVAVLSGALFLQRAQRLVPVYEAVRDLPSGVPLSNHDLAVVRVRLPAAELQRYARADRRRPVVGQVLTLPLRHHMLVPLDGLAASLAQADMVELPIKVAGGDMAQGLRPGDHVQVLAASSDGLRGGQARLLLPWAEVIRVLEEPSGLAGSHQSGVQVRVPNDRAAVVVGAIASARVFVVKAPPLPAHGAAAAEEPPDASQDSSAPSAPLDPSGRSASPDLPPSTGPDTPGSGP
jgi:hypothetical protein